jgi:preprotein translocase subunit YajC
MLTSLFVLLAEAENKPAQPEGSFLQQLFANPLPIMMMVGLLLFYVIFLRPMKRQEAERQTLLSKVKKNDEILTTGGIYATVIEVSDKEDKIIVKISDNVRVKIAKAAIARNITNEEEAAKAKEQPAKKEGAA